MSLGRPPIHVPYPGHITKLRHHLTGYKLYEVAAAVGIPQTTLSMYLVGRRQLADNLNLLFKLSRILKVREEDLVGFMVDPDRERIDA